MSKDREPPRDLSETGAPPVEGARWLWVKLGVWAGALLLLAWAAWGLAWVLSNVTVRLDLPPPTPPSQVAASGAAPPETSPEPAPEVNAEGQMITSPAWLQAPQPEYPRAAQRAGEESGRVRLECRTNTEGRLHACRIAEEAPAGVGFGQEAVKATAKARVRPRLVDGEPADGRIAFTIRYRLD